MTFVSGYTVCLRGNWGVLTFLFSYAVILVFPVLYLGWKIIKKMKFKSSLEVDLYHDLEEIEEYTRSFVPKPNKNWADKYFNEVFS